MLVAGTSASWTSRVGAALAHGPVSLEMSSSGAVALARIESAADAVALIVLEAFLDDMSGLAFCRRLRESASGASPLVLLVSPWVDEMDRVLAFECGVDDFAPDPFFPRELASRIQALLRRERRPPTLADESEARIGPLRVDFRKSVVEVDERPVSLTWREFEVVRVMTQRQGRVVRRETLIALLLGASDAASPRLIDTYVKSIRRKLGRAGRLIETVRSVGYRLTAISPLDPGSSPP